MKSITTYSARRSNFFMWLAVLLMVFSAIERCIWLSKQNPEGGLLFAIFSAIFPLAANFLIALRLPIRGEKYFYVTIRPVIFITLCYIYGFIKDLRLVFSPRLFILIVLCILQCILYYLTFSGRIPSKWPVFAAYSVYLPVPIYFIFKIINSDGAYAVARNILFSNKNISDFSMYLGIIAMILSAIKLPPIKDGEPYRFRYGDRMDGRLIRGGIPLDKVSPYIMVNRNGANNLLSDSIEVSAMEKYVHKKRKEGLKHFGITHVLIASYMRMCAEYPGIMRFISGQKVYQRMKIKLKMVVKKDLKIGSPETIISVDLLPSDTADDVYQKFDEQVQIANISEDLDSGFDKLAGLLNLIPGAVLKFLVWFLKTLDYFGLLPPELLELSPFHGSLFLTSMGSLGIPPVFHHLYDFGNIPVFIAFGAKRTEYELDSDGMTQRKKYLDYNVVTDERIVDGQYYAAALKRIRSIMLHPEQLDNPPENIKEDIY